MDGEDSIKNYGQIGNQIEEKIVFLGPLGPLGPIISLLVELLLMELITKTRQNYVCLSHIRNSALEEIPIFRNSCTIIQTIRSGAEKEQETKRKAVATAAATSEVSIDIDHLCSDDGQT